MKKIKFLIIFILILTFIFNITSCNHLEPLADLQEKTNESTAEPLDITDTLETTPESTQDDESTAEPSDVTDTNESTTESTQDDEEKIKNEQDIKEDIPDLSDNTPCIITDEFLYYNYDNPLSGKIANWLGTGELPSNANFREKMDYVYFWDGFQKILVRTGDTYMGLYAEEIKTSFLEFDDGKVYYTSKSIKFSGLIEVKAKVGRYNFDPSNSLFLSAAVHEESLNTFPTNRFTINSSEMLEKILDDGFDGSLRIENVTFEEFFKKIEYTILVKNLWVLESMYEDFMMNWSSAELVSFTRIG